MKNYILAVLSATALSFSLDAKTDEGAVALPFTAINQNPQSAAMGGVSIWNNAASTSFTEKRGHAMAGYQKWGLSSSDFISFDAAYLIARKAGVRVGCTRQTESPYDIIDEYGETISSFQPSALKAGIGAGMKFGEHFSAGADLFYARRDMSEIGNYSAFAADLAVMAQFRHISIAAGVKRLGTTVKSQDGSGSFSLPSSAFLSLGNVFSFGETHSLSAAAELEYFFYGSCAVSAGAEYSFKEIVSVRGGYHLGGIIPDHASAGLGLNIKGVCLNATCLFGKEGINGTMLFGLGYWF